MRHTPVCPARQWELPPAFTGTMTSDLKFLERSHSRVLELSEAIRKTVGVLHTHDICLAILF